MGAMISGLCCAASCACSCFSCCCSAATGRDGVSGSMAKGIHVLMLGIATIVAIVMRYEGDQIGIDLGPWEVGCESGTVDTGVAEYDIYCKGDAAVFRISFCTTLFFFVTMLLSFCSPGFHRGWWGPKLILFFALLIGSVWIPNNVFNTDGYASVARVCSSLFLVLQILILVDFGYQWNEAWVGRAYAKADVDGSDVDSKWLVAVLVCAASLYLVAIAGIVLLFMYYADCAMGQGLTVGTLIAILGFTALSLYREQLTGAGGAILPAAVVAAYSVYLNWSALDSNPDDTCKPAGNKDAATIAIGIFVATGSLMWTSYSASRNAGGLMKGQSAEEVREQADLEKPFYGVDGNTTYGDKADGGDAEADVEAQKDKKASGVQASDGRLQHEGKTKEEAAEENAAAADAKESYWFFHLIMMTASMYMAMLLTNWGVPEADSDDAGDLSDYDNDGKAAMTVKIVSEWLTILLYVWTLIAPAVLSGREF